MKINLPKWNGVIVLVVYSRELCRYFRVVVIYKDPQRYTGGYEHAVCTQSSVNLINILSIEMESFIRFYNIQKIANQVGSNRTVSLNEDALTTAPPRHLDVKSNF